MYKKILVIKLRHIGDVLLTTAVFKTLKENFPNSFVAAVVNQGTEAVLERNPYLDEIITYDRGIKELLPYKRYSEEIKFLRKIRKMGFDTTIDLTGGDRAAVISYLSGAKTRIGIKSKGFFGKQYLYTELFEIDGYKHTVLQNLEVLAKVGIKIEKPEVILNVTESEKKWARKLIFSDHFSNNSEFVHFFHSKTLDKEISYTKKIVHIHPTSRWLFKCWKDEYMAKVIKWFIDKGYRVVLTSSSEEKEMKKIQTILSHIPSNLIYESFPKDFEAFFCNSESFSNDSESFFCHSERGEESPRLINLSGKLTLRQLIAVSSVCDIYFGIDTAPMHMAAAFGKPVIALFGPSGAFNWGPWDNESGNIPYPERNGIQRFGKNIVIQRDWQCIPCGQDGCKGSKISKCLFDIKPDEVIEILKSLLDK
ncbi:MAG: glycosyltransferase family 9 protein [Thermodesulfovibrio sp.]|nr:glycosyltransferase family 9 protein [Thermodesulfovibrio sp.]MDW7998113.1 glycosyltransferase family 9 protein [Thermodesulfovibrio sp.]